MDRLYLRGLVQELDRAFRGRYLRAVRLSRDETGIGLALSGPEPSELRLRLGPRLSGIHTRVSPSDALSERERDLTRLLGKSEIERIEADPLDRVATFALGKKRLSGRRTSSRIVMELFATRAAIYVLAHDDRVVERISLGGARLRPGDAYRAAPPPPGAATEADEETFRMRLGARDPDKRALLEASGLTPLLVGEILHGIRTLGLAPGDAHRSLTRRLETPEPALYVDGSRYVLSPVRLHARTEEPAVASSSFIETLERGLVYLEERGDVEVLRASLRSAARKAIARWTTLRQKLEATREAANDAESLRRIGEALLSGLTRARREGDHAVRVPDPRHPEGEWLAVSIDPRKDLAHNAETYFRRARKLDRSKSAVASRLAELEERIGAAQGLLLDLEDASSADVLDALRHDAIRQGLVERERTRGRETPVPAVGPRRYSTERGNVILVGRSSRGNDELTFETAKPRDLWFHASGIPGSHVVLRLSGGLEPTEDEITRAASLAAYFSRARGESAVDVMYTERREVSRIPGAPPGRVRVGSHRTIRVAPRTPDAEPSA